jgi:hypothetical protein
MLVCMCMFDMICECTEISPVALPRNLDVMYGERSARVSRFEILLEQLYQKHLFLEMAATVILVKSLEHVQFYVFRRCILTKLVRRNLDMTFLESRRSPYDSPMPATAVRLCDAGDCDDLGWR